MTLNNLDASLISAQFTQPLLAWSNQFGRTDLPWQNPRTPYRVYVSEIMLQQTQVKTVLPYFERFMARFPNLEALACATEDEVLSYWTGLGYYSRARNMHKTAKELVHAYGGEFPSDPVLLTQLPGIGPSTAAAIASLAFNLPFAILDGNVKRVLARYFLIDGVLNTKKIEQTLYRYAHLCMSPVQCSAYTQAIMDLGATCCKPKQPTCSVCPLKQTCLAYQQDCVERYPFPAPKKSLPIQDWSFFIFFYENAQGKRAIYLEKRESQGIWGGLWCPPVKTHDSNAQAWILQHFATRPNSIQMLTPIKHSFTHFHLNIHGFSIKLDQPLPILATNQWFFPEDLPQLGMPKPVLTLLERL